MGSEKTEVESHKKLLCLDDDLDLLYSFLYQTKKILTKGKAKELIKYTINLDTNLRKSIALGRSRLFYAQDDVFESKFNENLPETKHYKSVNIQDAPGFSIDQVDGTNGSDYAFGQLEKIGLNFDMSTSQNRQVEGGKSSALLVQLAQKAESPMPAGEVIKLRRRNLAQKPVH